MSENLRFTNMLNNLMSSDNSLRKDAENGYEPLPYEAKIMFLLQAIGNYSSSEATRQLAALLLRQQLSLSFKEIYPNISDLVKTSLKIGLLTSIQQERVAKVRTKLCDVVAELARVLVDKDGNHYWPELHTFLLDSVNSPDGGLREGALHIFWSFPGIFGNIQHQVLPVIKCMLVQCMQDQTYPRVRYAAARATLAFVLFSGAQRKEHNQNSKNNLVIKHLTDMLPAIVQQLNDSCYQGEDLLLTSFVEIADKVATYLEPNLEMVLRLCLKLNADVNLRDVQRQMAMEVIVTLSETAAATLRNHTDIVTQSISQMLAMMVDLEENDEWLRSDELEEDDCHSNATSGESALDRLARGLGGTMVLPIVERHIFQMLQTPDWKYRHAGLMALSAIGEGCHQQMDNILDEVLNSVLVFCADDHPRVCYAACNALGRLATDFSPSFQKKFHDRVIPTLLQNLVHQEIPRVQAQAVAALVNFTDGCPKSIFTLYLEPLMPRLQQVLNVKLQELIQKGNKMVLEQVVILIASAAETVGKTFSMYYDLFMPQLTHIVENALHLPLRVLRGKTIESISVVGVAVGKEKFFPDASAVMELLLKSQTESNDLEDDDPQAPYMISAWARMCEILGKEFSKYLPLVMGPLMKAASIKPEVFDYARLEEISEDDNWECFNVGDENLAIRTASLEEKTTGCQMLVCYAKELKEGFVEYTEPVVKLMVPFLRFQFHEGVRVYAAQSLPLLLECAGCRGREYVTQMWLFMCDALMAAISSEPDLEVLPDIMVAFAKCVEMMGSGSLSDEQFDTLGKVLRERLEVGFKEQDLRQLKRQSHTYDDSVEEMLQEEEEIYVEILIRVSDIMYSVFLSYRESILPWFEKLLDVVVGRVSPHRFWGERMLGLCVFDYVIEYCSPTSFKYAPLFLKPMLDSLCDSRRDVRQAASHGVGVMAQHGGENYRLVCTEALPRLIAVIQAADSEKSGNATDNCISAIGKIMRFRPECTNVDEILPHWLGWLPLKHDKYEATYMLDFLCELIEGNNPIVLGEDASNLPNIVLIFADGVENEMIEKECCGRIAGVIRRIQGSEGLWSRCVSCLNEIQRAAIDNLLSAARA